MEKNKTLKTSTKVIVIAVLTLLLNIPLLVVNSQVTSRQESEGLALESVKKSWGDAAVLKSPAVELMDEVYLPANSDTHVQIDVQQKKRGYFSVPVYTAKIQMKVRFNRPKVDTSENKKIINNLNRLKLPHDGSKAIINFKITEVDKKIELPRKISDKWIFVESASVSDKDFFDKDFLIEMELRGVDMFTFKSLSENEKFNVKSNWKESKFDGDILPFSTVVTSNNVEANWSLSTSNDSSTPNSVDVKLLWNNPDYKKIDRMMNYGFLFITLIFVTFFILEFSYKSKIHPVQYGTVGIAISVFYLLLLALLEKIGFDSAYIIASISIISLITYYMAAAFKSIRAIFIIVLVEAILHSYFYVILSLEDMAFLIGTLGLFLALATFMIITRKFDWYESLVDGNKNE